jgi:sugar phosphate isomerase/epimerase
MQISCHTTSFPLLSFEQSLKVIGILEFEAADLWAYVGEPHLQPDVIEADPEGQAERTKRALADAGLASSDVLTTFGHGFRDRPVNTPDPATRAANRRRFAALVRFCRLVDCPGITLLPGVIWDDLGADRSFDLAREALTELVADGRDAGLRVSIEAHLESVVEQPERAIELVKAVPGLQFTLDYTHFITPNIAPERVHPMIPYTGHFHARQGAPGQLQSLDSEGTIDFADIVRRLKGADYDGYLCVEYTWQNWFNMNRLDIVSESVILRDKLKSYLAN